MADLAKHYKVGGEKWPFARSVIFKLWALNFVMIAVTSKLLQVLLKRLLLTQSILKPSNSTLNSNIGQEACLHKSLQFLILAVIFTHAPTVQADESRDELCTKMGVIAGRAMGARISGVPINDLLNAGFHPAFREISQTIILDAYSRSMPPLETEMIQTMSDFRNEIELKCHNSQR